MSLKYEIENGEVTITNYSDHSVKLVIIPENIDNFPVTNIKYLGNLSDVEDLIIPKSVTHISDDAFELMVNLKYINNRKIINHFCVINNRFIKFSHFIYIIKHQISNDYVCDFLGSNRFFINRCWCDEYFSR